ncbi:serine hydrolase domain-containing protein [Amycolatopsis sp. NBC_00438]|uniref:serine hydrolase domain-containing protein n=1 Tax=Amycolatopsis sp. NBC_00438 TaxID=2903558 RepID=UPI002E21B808
MTGSGGQWSGTSGVHDIATGAPVRSAGTFRIDSVTKVFTAVLLFQLLQEHRVQLDEPAQRYLPGV